MNQVADSVVTYINIKLGDWVIANVIRLRLFDME